MYCGTCGGENPEGARFCAACGGAIDPGPERPTDRAYDRAAVKPAVADAAPVPTPPAPGLATPVEGPSAARPETPKPPRPGGVIRRFLALVFDVLIFLAIYYVASSLFAYAESRTLSHMVFSSGGKDLDRVLFRFTLANYAWMVVVVLLYWVVAESSRFQGTIGKRIFGLRVTNLHAERVSLFRALFRNLFKAFSAAPCFLGFLAAGVSPRKRALHDVMSGCLVVRRGR